MEVLVAKVDDNHDAGGAGNCGPLVKSVSASVPASAKFLTNQQCRFHHQQQHNPFCVSNKRPCFKF
jgi:hypothetical protein